MTTVEELEDTKRRALRKKWKYVARLCREAAEAASLYEDPAKVRRLLLRAAKHTAEAERLARSSAVVQAHVEDGVMVNSATSSTKIRTTLPTTESTTTS